MLSRSVCYARYARTGVYRTITIEHLLGGAGPRALDHAGEGGRRARNADDVDAGCGLCDCGGGQRGLRACLGAAQPIDFLSDYYTHYFKSACLECVHLISIVISI